MKIAALLTISLCAFYTVPALAQADDARSPAVAFMQDMITHHSQALDMAALVPARAASEDIKVLAQRIETSQTSEIDLMRNWLASQHVTTGAHGGHMQHMSMPGMASPEQMQQLQDASGAAFDSLFLALMIHHHEGALTMVADLLGSSGGLDPLVFQLASSIDADQRAEIARMRKLQAVTFKQGSEK